MQRGEMRQGINLPARHIIEAEARFERGIFIYMV